MKKIFFTLFILFAVKAVAQDVIVKKDGTTIVSKVFEIGKQEVKYKKFSNIDGPIYLINIDEISVINFENGEKEVFESYGISVNEKNIVNNRPLSDNELVDLDYRLRNPKKLSNLPMEIKRKVKKYRKVGWIGGAVLLASGVYVMFERTSETIFDDDDAGLYVGAVAAGCGVLWTTGFLCYAQHIKNKYIRDNNIALWQNELNFNNGSTLLTGIDLLHDEISNNKTLGVGLRLNF